LVQADALAACGKTAARNSSESEHRKEDPSEDTTLLLGTKSLLAHTFCRAEFALTGAGAGATESLQNANPSSTVIVLAGQVAQYIAPAVENLPAGQSVQANEPEESA